MIEPMKADYFLGSESFAVVMKVNEIIEAINNQPASEPTNLDTVANVLHYLRQEVEIVASENIAAGSMVTVNIMNDGSVIAAMKRMGS